MLSLTCIGVYSRDNAFGLWGQVKVPVGDKVVTLDVQITEPALDTAKGANDLARDVLAQLNPDAEFLPF